MDPEVIAALQKLMASKFATDTLSALSGGGMPKAGILNTPYAGLQGAYWGGPAFVPGTDTLAIGPQVLMQDAYYNQGWKPKDEHLAALLWDAPDYSVASPRNVLSHEMGHRAQAKNQFPGYFGNAFQQLYAAPTTSRDRLLIHGVDKPSELEAEAFASAVDFLAGLSGGKIPKASYEKDLPDQPFNKETINAGIEIAEMRMPGFSLMLNHLLTQPMYRNHPVAKLFQSQGEVNAKRTEKGQRNGQTGSASRNSKAAAQQVTAKGGGR